MEFQTNAISSGEEQKISTHRGKCAFLAKDSAKLKIPKPLFEKIWPELNNVWSWHMIFYNLLNLLFDETPNLFIRLHPWVKVTLRAQFQLCKHLLSENEFWSVKKHFLPDFFSVASSSKLRPRW